MYVEIKENKLISWCDYQYNDDYEFVEIDIATFDPSKYEVTDGILVDISQSPEYIEKKRIEALQIHNAKIKNQIEELELSQNRALREIIVLEDTSFSRNKLSQIEQEIESLRNQLIQ